jgi:nitrous oxidase accessory protein
MRTLAYTIFTLLAMALASDAAANVLQQRIDAAKPGDTIVVDAGTYGPIRVDKSITLIGQGMPTIDGGGKGDVIILADASPITIRGFVIRGSGADLDRESTGVRVLKSQTTIENCRFEDVLFAIDLKQAKDCVIRSNYLGSKPLDIARRGDVLRLFRSDNCLIENNIIEDGRDALLWYSNHVTVRGNISRRNRYGFHAMYSNDVRFEDNLLIDNSVGIYLMYGKGFTLQNNRILRNRGVSGYGIGFKEVDEYEVRDNVLSGNRVGMYIDGSPMRRKAGTANFVGNNVSCNDVGMMLLPSVKGNRITGNNFIDNLEQVGVLGRGTVQQNEFAHDGRGNFWNDYGGYDANRDGVGDQAYAPSTLFENLIDREPKLRLMLFSPAHDAIDFIGRAMPATRSAPKFRDHSPLVAPVSLNSSAGGPSTSVSLGWAALLLVGASGLLILLSSEVPAWVIHSIRRRPFKAVSLKASQT